MAGGASIWVRLELRAATTTVVPDPAPSDVLDHKQDIRHQLDSDLPEGLRQHFRGNRRLGWPDRTAVELWLLRAGLTGPSEKAPAQTVSFRQGCHGQDPDHDADDCEHSDDKCSVSSTRSDLTLIANALA